MKCWICGDETAGSREHMTKRADLRSRLGSPSPQKPLTVIVTAADGATRIKKARSDKADVLKSNAPMCAKCNNERTQPYDYAWDALSAHLGSIDPIEVGKRIVLSKVFPGRVRQSMLDVQLYFVKAFGCRIVDGEESFGGMPFDIEQFASSLLHRTPHPDVYLAICPPSQRKHPIIGSSRLRLRTEGPAQRAVNAGWFYYLDCATVAVYFANRFYAQYLPRDFWHPSTIGKTLRVARSDKDKAPVVPVDGAQRR
jgi:hypothetical protein